MIIEDRLMSNDYRYVAIVRNVFSQTVSIKRRDTVEYLLPHWRQRSLELTNLTNVQVCQNFFGVTSLVTFNVIHVYFELSYKPQCCTYT